MQPEPQLLAQWMTLIALVLATFEYFVIVRRRTVHRRFVAIREEAAESGLRGLVRIIAAD